MTVTCIYTQVGKLSLLILWHAFYRDTKLWFCDLIIIRNAFDSKMFLHKCHEESNLDRLFILTFSFKIVMLHGTMITSGDAVTRVSFWPNSLHYNPARHNQLC
jgi:hypothetical protein